jgi:hypothetical protein
MATAKDFRRIALALEGTTEAPHFDRTAFKVRRIYATLAADGKTANLMLTADEQELKCALAPDAFRPVPNAWGRPRRHDRKTVGAAHPGVARCPDHRMAHAVSNKPKRRR